MEQAAEALAEAGDPAQAMVQEPDDKTQISVPPKAGLPEETALEDPPSEPVEDSDDRTQVISRSETNPPNTEASHVCPKCGATTLLEQLSKRDYRCPQCNLEMAYLDYAPNGDLRGIFGWLLSPGDMVLGRYRVETVLGKGGFGATYLVSDQQLSGKRRALKEVPKLMFDVYEADLLIRLDHPAIPDIIERKEVGDMFYMVLKFGGSRTLGAERKQSPDMRIPEAKLLPWMRQLCEVLIYLHGQNPPIVHRDLKPDNILLNEEDRIMLIDFGIAKESKPESMTRTLARAASPGYSSLEQIMGNRTDERSDIYSLGATFYALLTGLKPPGADERVSGKRLMPPSEAIPGVSPQVEAAIIQALSLNVNDRQQTMKEFFAQAFGNYEPGSGGRLFDDERTQVLGLGGADATLLSTPSKTRTRTTASAPQASSRSMPVLAGMAVIAAALGGGAYYWLTQPTQPAAVPTTTKPSFSAILPAGTPSTPGNVVGKPESGPLSQPEQPNPAADLPPPVPKAARTAEQQLIDFIPHLTGFPITLSHPFYREEDSIEFALDLPRPGYLHVFILEPGGKATLVFPNKLVPNNQVQAGTLRLPNGRPALKASPPFGKSWFIAITEPKPNNLFQQNLKDGRKNLFFVEMTAWQLLGFLQDRLSDKESMASGAEMQVCAKSGPCE